MTECIIPFSFQQLHWFNAALVLITYFVLTVSFYYSMKVVFSRKKRELSLSKRWAPTMFMLNSLIVQSEESDPATATLCKLLLLSLDPENCPKTYADDVDQFKKEHNLT